MEFKSRVYKNKIKIPMKIINELGVKNGDIISVDLLEE